MRRILVRTAAGGRIISVMKHGLPLVVTLLVLLCALEAHAGQHIYRTGVLKRVGVRDLNMRLPMPTAPGQPDVDIPLHVGINYQFEIQSDTIIYVATCWSKGKRNYGSEWIVNDPAEFRFDKDKLFLKRPGKGELRLALLTRLRVRDSQDESTSGQTSIEPLPAFATQHTVPECR